jgi:hypothetical protein
MRAASELPNCPKYGRNFQIELDEGLVFVRGESEMARFPTRKYQSSCGYLSIHAHDGPRNSIEAGDQPGSSLEVNYELIADAEFSGVGKVT